MAVLRFHADCLNGTGRLATVGELDSSTAPAFEGELARIEVDEPSVIIVDLRRLKFMDSTGLSALLGAAARARTCRRRLVLAMRPGPVMRLLEVTALDRRFEIVGDPDEALAPGGRSGRRPVVTGDP